MNHLALQIGLDDIEPYLARLQDKGVECMFIAHNWVRPTNLNGTVADIGDDTFCASIYFEDPDGVQLEMCALLPAWSKLGSDLEPRGRVADGRESVGVPVGDP